MALDNKNVLTLPDPAAVFSIALSLWQACQNDSRNGEPVNLSENYNGMDQFMREVMRVADQFEIWACANIDFDRLTDVWPYLLEEKFGDTCLTAISSLELKSFD